MTTRGQRPTVQTQDLNSVSFLSRHFSVTYSSLPPSFKINYLQYKLSSTYCEYFNASSTSEQGHGSNWWKKKKKKEKDWGTSGNKKESGRLCKENRITDSFPASPSVKSCLSQLLLLPSSPSLFPSLSLHPCHFVPRVFHCQSQLILWLCQLFCVYK